MPPSPSQPVYTLDAQSVRVLQRLINQVRSNTSGLRNLPGNTDLWNADINTQDIFIARTPSGGIPGLSFTGTGSSVSAGTGTTGTGESPLGTGTGTETINFRTGDTAGYADDCEFLRIDRTTGLIESYVTLRRRLWNLSTCDIQGDKYVLAAKEKHGNYIALDVFPDTCIDLGTGTEEQTVIPQVNGAGWTAGLCRDDCLQLTVRSATGNCSGIDTTQILTLTSTDGNDWISTESFLHCLGSSIVTFSVEAGIPTLLFDAFYAVLDSAGQTDEGFYIDFAISKGVCNDCQYGTGSGEGTGSGSGTSDCGEQAACGRNLLVVRLTCVECPVDEGTGTGNGGSSCDEATELTLGQSGSGSYTSGVPYTGTWWTITGLTPATTYHLDITGLPTGGITAVNVYTSGCESPVLVGSRGTDGCLSFSSGAGTQVWISVSSSNPSNSGTFEFTSASGGC